jgi:high potential iron-sulfur protein
MTPPIDPSRRQLLRGVAVGLSLAPLAAPVLPAEPPLISESDPAAKAVHYVEDARRASGATDGALCASCSLYSGAAGADRGSCTLFPGKLVQAAGWCSSWSSL